MPKVSIIIRSKNEESWIKHCLIALKKQTYQDFEIILVDNNSEDFTIKLAKKEFKNIKVLTIDKYFPGKSLNYGISKSSGNFIFCLSAHCIPVNNNWISELLSSLEKENIAAVYGRQVPAQFSKPEDKRDLYITFGIEDKIQKEDTFFHNANSAFKKSVWDKINFKEDVTNIEDRIWANEIIKMGYWISYNSRASVIHHHGIHHGNNPKRLESTLSTMSKINTEALLTHIPKKFSDLSLLFILFETRDMSKKINWEEIKRNICLIKNKHLNAEIIICSEDIPDDIKNNIICFEPRDKYKEYRFEEMAQELLNKYELKNLPKDHVYFNSLTNHFHYDIFDRMYKFSIYSASLTVIVGEIINEPVWEYKDEKFFPINKSEQTRDDRKQLVKSRLEFGVIISPQVLRLKKSHLDGEVDFYLIDK